jgi:hypothetical protein
MTTALPDFVSEISGMLVTLLPVAALGAIVLAGLRLRGEGGINYDAGGSFFKWLFWGALLLTLPAIFSATIPALFSGGPAPVPPSAAGTGTFGSVATSLTTGITSFVTNILVGRIVPLMAAALCFKGILDSSEGHSPLPSIDHFGALCVGFTGVLDTREDLVHLFQQHYFHRSVRIRRRARQHVQLPGHDDQPVCRSPVLRRSRNQLPTIQALGRGGPLRARISEF